MLFAAHGVQTLPDLPEEDGVALRIDAFDGQSVREVLGRKGSGGEQQRGGYCECCPASIPQAARMSSPREERMVHRIWCLFSRSRNASIAMSDAHS